MRSRWAGNAVHGIILTSGASSTCLSSSGSISLRKLVRCSGQFPRPETCHLLAAGPLSMLALFQGFQRIGEALYLAHALVPLEAVA